jgi:hypothetical protein
VKQFIHDNYDIGGTNSPAKKSDVIPQSWFSCDIKLGVSIILFLKLEQNIKENLTSFKEYNNHNSF